MDEIKSVERMVLVLDPAIHVNAAFAAAMALDRGGFVHHFQLVAVFQYLDRVTRHDRDLTEGRAIGLPAPGAAADMVVGGLAPDPDLDRVAGAMAGQRSAGKAGTALFHAVIDVRVNPDPVGMCHGPLLR